MSSRTRTTAARDGLHEAGLRATTARLAVLDALALAAGPLTHQQVNDRLSRAHVDRSTVFRALQDLAAASLVRRLEVGDHVWRYEIATRDCGGIAPRLPHSHLLCTGCGGVTCLGADAVAVAYSEALGAVEEIILKGRCHDCTRPVAPSLEGAVP